MIYLLLFWRFCISFLSISIVLIKRLTLIFQMLLNKGTNGIISHFQEGKEISARVSISSDCAVKSNATIALHFAALAFE